MGKRATVGTCLASLVKMAVPLCQQAERECPRTGPGRKPEIADWVLAVLIMVAVMKRKKSESAQYRFLSFWPRLREHLVNAISALLILFLLRYIALLSDRHEKS